ncbi:Tfp pilus assembly protein FimT/FimU [[Limnothrix rosea] IAM M-220]|uniref:pilus assembly FimT family protein n=1 Tax=[Limnothrix rosea] IAM M-220 TaxID=454133 RepID=UPI00095AF00B|nr:prepilin-type N-terminal cleavage/methylation domain-containing protein [[Limnothrix rosea] IAM M-220]OKH18738.1 hypothetical protein NIES208_04570 [[Limnothrix rosea] IAM M-220]
MNNTQDQGFTILELLAALAIIGILSAITTPLIMWANKPLQNGTYQAAGIFSQGRSRAIATTSALRIQPNPSNPEHSFIVQASDTRSCDPNTTVLTGAIATDSNQLAVVSTQGFAAGDRLKIGDDETENVVLTTDSNSATLTLGKPIGTAHSSGTTVEIIANWQNDKTFFQEDMTLPDTVKMIGNLADWELCFDSRGIATVSDTFGIAEDDLEITLISEKSQKEGKIIVFQGGMIDSVVIQPKDDIVVAALEDAETNTSNGSSAAATGSSTTTNDPSNNGSNATSNDNGTSTDTPPQPNPDYQLDEGVIVPSTSPTNNTTPETNTGAIDDNSFDSENLTFEQRRAVYQEWLDQNEYYQSILQGTETVDRDSEPYKEFVKEIIEKLTWLYS